MTQSNQTRDLLACSAVPQPTVPPGTPGSSKWDTKNLRPQTNYAPTKLEPTTNLALDWEARDQYCTGVYESIGNGHVDLECKSFWDDAPFASDWKINIRNERYRCFMSHLDDCELLLRNPNFGYPKAVRNRWARAFEETVTSHCCVRLILAQFFRELAEDGTYVPRNIEMISNLCMLYPSRMVTTLIHRHHTLCHNSRIFLSTPMEQQPLVGQVHLLGMIYDI